MIKVLFVCLGNICRSPMAESIFQSMLESRGLTKVVECDSAGTGAYHIGRSPDPRTLNVLKTRGIISCHKGRQVSVVDFDEYDYIIAMDTANVNELKRLEAMSRHKTNLWMMRDFDTEKTVIDVPDPYYDDLKAFEDTYVILNRCCESYAIT